MEDPLAKNYGDVPILDLQSKVTPGTKVWTEIGKLAEPLKEQYVLVRGCVQRICAKGKTAFMVLREIGFTVQCLKCLFFVFVALFGCQETISNLKAIAKGGACDSESLTKRQPSRVMVVTALIWKALLAAAKARHGNFRASILCHSLNLRGKTALPMPDNSFGNLYMVANARFGGDNESKIELHELVDALHDSIRNALHDCKNSHNGDDLVSIITKSLRDFGWGNPTWMSIVAIPFEIVSLFDTKDGDGVEAWVSLSEKTMLLFENYPEIKAFTSQI
ncbi:hypothetical protein SO802_021937 [Lithocarpus litseifolius]|uniref:Uncharacterized protein n=1 Tax=Lithocarpus litseifolius TaxID=425828 RepID=A0AAW2CGH6_9ROSI